jgi:hypothetical protein
MTTTKQIANYRPRQDLTAVDSKQILDTPDCAYVVETYGGFSISVDSTPNVLTMRAYIAGETEHTLTCQAVKTSAEWNFNGPPVRVEEVELQTAAQASALSNAIKVMSAYAAVIARDLDIAYAPV